MTKNPAYFTPDVDEITLDENHAPFFYKIKIRPSTFVKCLKWKEFLESLMFAVLTAVLSLVDIEDKIYLALVGISIVLNLYLAVTHYANNQWSELKIVKIKYGIYNSYVKSLTNFKRRSVILRVLYIATPFVLLFLLLLMSGFIANVFQTRDETVVAVLRKENVIAAARDLPAVLANITQFDDRSSVICFSEKDPPDVQDEKKTKDSQAVLLCVANMVIWLMSYVLLIIINRSVEFSPSYDAIKDRLIARQDVEIMPSELANLLCNADTEISEEFIGELRALGIDIKTFWVTRDVSVALHRNITIYLTFFLLAMQAPITLKYAKPAGQVLVASSIDNWQSRTTAEAQDGVFTATLRGDIGARVYFKFIVDGNWTTDDSYASEADASGNVNNYVDVPTPVWTGPQFDINNSKSEAKPAVVAEPKEEVSAWKEQAQKEVEKKSEPVVEKTEAVIQKTEPVAEKTEPVIQKTEPVAAKTEPVIQKTEPVVEKTEPVIQSEKTESTVEKDKITAQSSEITVDSTTSTTKKKQPFWKRMFGKKDAPEAEQK